MDRLHVTLDDAEAGALKQAFKLRGRKERVVALNDNLGYGPIDPATVAGRRRWIAEYWLMGDDPGMHEHIEATWREIMSPCVMPVVWFSRRYAYQYCGFLEIVSRREVMVVDLTDVAFSRPDPYRRLGYVTSAELARGSLFDRAGQLSSTDLRRYRERWRRAKAENAAIRRISAGRIIGSPITKFDPVVLRCVPERWKSCGLVLKDVLNSLGSIPDVHRLTMFVWSRIRALGKAGAFEVQGDLDEHAALYDCNARRRP